MNILSTLRSLPAGLLVLAGVLLFQGAAGAQQVYKCTTPDGKTAFQQQPCTPGHGGAVQVRPNVVDHSGLRQQAARFDALRGPQLDSAGLVRQGMSVDDLVSRLGSPTAVNTDRNGSGVDQQLVYRFADGSVRYIYTSNGRVTTVQERSGYGRARGTQPCYDATALRSARMDTNAMYLTPEARAAAVRRLEQMQACRR